MDTPMQLFSKIQNWRKKKAIYKAHNALYSKIFAQHPELFTPEKNEQDWLNKWRQYDPDVQLASYRIFSKFIGENLNIMPLETCAYMVEPTLNSNEKNKFYDDKNTLHLYLPDNYLPRVLLRNINGIFYDGDYLPLKKDINSYLNCLKEDKLIIKPSKECSGHGVQLIYKEGEKYFNFQNEIIDFDYLSKRYKSDFLIQECLVQSDFMAQFNQSSVNTVRIFTYRDDSGTIIPMHSIIRIGGKGAHVDNAHSGGMFCGIKSNGELGNYCCSWLGDKVDTFNNIDFSSNSFYIPNYEAIKDFSRSIAAKIPFQNLIAMDIALDKHNNPILLEVNIEGFSAWLFQFTIGPVFDSYTDEIMKKCINA